MVDNNTLRTLRSLMLRKIHLSRDAVAVVDDADYEKVACNRWYCTAGGYAARSLPRPDRGMEYMHRVIAGAGPGDIVDHLDGDPLNNSRSNLRLTSQKENTRNRRGVKGTSSRFKGVSWHKGGRKWSAQIVANGKNRYLGLFIDEEEAARAYNAAAIEEHGESARLNVLD